MQPPKMKATLEINHAFVRILIETFRAIFETIAALLLNVCCMIFE
jgi:hypothetical protein